MSIIYDTKEIGRIARLRALEGFNQNETLAVGVDPGVAPPVEMPSDSNPQDSEYFYGVGFVASDDTELYGADIGCLSA